MLLVLRDTVLGRSSRGFRDDFRPKDSPVEVTTFNLSIVLIPQYLLELFLSPAVFKSQKSDHLVIGSRLTFGLKLDLDLREPIFNILWISFKFVNDAWLLLLLLKIPPLLTVVSGIGLRSDHCTATFLQLSLLVIAVVQR